MSKGWIIVCVIAVGFLVAAVGWYAGWWSPTPALKVTTAAADEASAGGGEAASGRASAGGEDEVLAQVRALAGLVRGRVLGPAPRPRYEDLWQALQRLSRAVTPERVAALLEDQTLGVVERHLLEIALAHKEKPKRFADLKDYYDQLLEDWRTGKRPVRRNLAIPRPPADLLTAEYWRAWEWDLLATPIHHVGFTAADALAIIGDTRSLDLMVVAYQWHFAYRGAYYSAWILGPLGRWKEEGLPQALDAAYACWLYARSMVGQQMVGRQHPLGQEETRITQEDVNRVLDFIADSFPRDFLLAQLQAAEPGSLRAAFLQQALQYAWPPLSPPGPSG